MKLITCKSNFFEDFDIDTLIGSIFLKKIYKKETYLVGYGRK
jgi:hypothetical protein